MKEKLIKALREHHNISKDIVPDEKVLSMKAGGILIAAAELSLKKKRGLHERTLR